MMLPPPHGDERKILLGLFGLVAALLALAVVLQILFP